MTLDDKAREELAELLRTTRKKRCTQRDIANEMGLGSAQYVSNAERGETMPSLEMLRAYQQLDPKNFRTKVASIFFDSVRRALK